MNEKQFGLICDAVEKISDDLVCADWNIGRRCISRMLKKFLSDLKDNTDCKNSQESMHEFPNNRGIS